MIGMGRRSRPDDRPGAFDFMGWRRRAVSDRTWFGLGLVTVGVAVPLQLGGWAWLLTLAVPVGLALIVSGLRRAVARARSQGLDLPTPPL
jgi:hypothetical protein